MRLLESWSRSLEVLGSESWDRRRDFELGVEVMERGEGILNRLWLREDGGNMGTRRDQALCEGVSFKYIGGRCSNEISGHVKDMGRDAGNSNTELGSAIWSGQVSLGSRRGGEIWTLPK